MNRYRNLYKRILYLESLLFEGSNNNRDAIFKFLGKDYYDKWCLIEDDIKDPMYKHYHTMAELGIDDVKDYIDSFFRSKRNKDKMFTIGSAKLLYDKDGWRVYRITSYKAAHKYGYNTGWDIAYNEQYFYECINDYHLDGGYYFYIKNNNEKYCLLRRKNGDVHSILDIDGNKLFTMNILNVVPDFPNVKAVFDVNRLQQDNILLSNDFELIKNHLQSNDSVDVNKLYKVDRDRLTPMAYHIIYGKHDDNTYRIIKLLIHSGAENSVFNLYNGVHMTSMMITCSLDHLDALKILANYFTETNIKNIDGNSSMAYIDMASKNAKDMVSLLLYDGANPNILNSEGNAPIVSAAIANRGDIVKLLLDEGADVKYLYKRFDKLKADKLLDKFGLSKYKP